MVRTLALLGGALLSFAAGAALAGQHPLWPLAVLLLFGSWSLAVAWRPALWLVGVPALLPLLNFSPWTGWLMVEEFDLLLLATLAGGYGRLALCDSTATADRRLFEVHSWWLLALGLAGGLGLYRGFADAGSFSLDGFAGYDQASNSLRIFKSLGFALLISPLLRRELQINQAQTCKRLAAGMVAGLTVVALAALWERAAFPGVFDFSTHYRTVALFWEMHVGGAALDAYLALAAPFAVWALHQARRPVAWAAAALLLLAVVYAGLTTFSRGVYLAVAAPMLLLGWQQWRQSRTSKVLALMQRMTLSSRLAGWRAKAGVLLAVAIGLEVVGVLGGGDFMARRLADAGQDLGSRMVHWQNGLGLLDTSGAALLGLGLGRLPAHYAQRVPGGEFSGAVQWQTEPVAGLDGSTAHAFVRLSGPKTRRALAGNFELTQRVSHILPGPQQIGLQVRVGQAVTLELHVCQRHLLYDRTCQSAYVKVNPVLVNGQPVWQPLAVLLNGPGFQHDSVLTPRLLMFSIGLLNAGTSVDLGAIEWFRSDGASVLTNGDFSNGLACWFAAAQSYFVPWHLDNLFLELLVERGLLGWLLLLIPVSWVVWRLNFELASQAPESPYVAAALTGLLLVGLVSSVMDVPRVAFLLYLFILWGAQVTHRPATTE